MTTEILTPNQVRERLAIVPTDFEKVLQEAEKNAVNVIYYSKSTPFGIYPMAVEMEKYIPLMESFEVLAQLSTIGVSKKEILEIGDGCQIHFVEGHPLTYYRVSEIQKYISKEALKKLQSDVVTSHVKPESIKYIF